MNETRINELTDQISKMKVILNDLITQLEVEKNKKESNIESRWKPENGTKYYFINENSINGYMWRNDNVDKDIYKSYNAWKTITRAEEVFNKTKLLWLMEQIHDILCPDYKPDWGDENEVKRSICFDFSCNEWVIDDCTYNSTHKEFTFFDTIKHTKQACKILNNMGVKPYSYGRA